MIYSLMLRRFFISDWSYEPNKGFFDDSSSESSGNDDVTSDDDDTNSDNEAMMEAYNEVACSTVDFSCEGDIIGLKHSYMTRDVVYDDRALEERLER